MLIENDVPRPNGKTMWKLTSVPWSHYSAEVKQDKITKSVCQVHREEFTMCAGLNRSPDFFEDKFNIDFQIY
jgi:hypothetical protein